jgi:hypothetical protein
MADSRFRWANAAKSTIPAEFATTTAGRVTLAFLARRAPFPRRRPALVCAESEHASLQVLAASLLTIGPEQKSGALRGRVSEVL